MKSLKLLGLTLAVGLIASAWVAGPAVAAREFLPAATAANPVTFTMSSGTGRFISLAGLEIKCLTDKGTGRITSATLGEFTIEFEDCTGPLGVKCADLSRADSTGIIATGGTFHLRMGLSGQPLGLIAFLLNTTHNLCSLSLIVLLGCFVGEVSKGVEELTNTVEVLIKQTGGDNTIVSTDGETNENEMSPCVLESKKGSEVEETLGGETHETFTSFTQNGVAVTSLIHI